MKRHSAPETHLENLAVVRPARYNDASAIAQIHVLSWQAAYRGLLPDKLLNQLDIGQRTQQWQDWLQQMPHKSEVAWVISQADTVVGFACCGPVRGDFAPCDGEIYAIYLLPGQQHRGLGSQLFAACRQSLTGQALQQHLVWVLRENHAARAFYAAQGGLPYFERRQRLGALAVEVDEVGYVWAATSF